MLSIEATSVVDQPWAVGGRINGYFPYTLSTLEKRKGLPPPSFTWERLLPYHEAEALILGVAVPLSNNTHPLRTSLPFYRDRDYRIRISGCLLYSSYKILCVTRGRKIGQRKPFMRLCTCKLSSWRAKSKE